MRPPSPSYYSELEKKTDDFGAGAVREGGSNVEMENMMSMGSKQKFIGANRTVKFPANSFKSLLITRQTIS